MKKALIFNDLNADDMELFEIYNNAIKNSGILEDISEECRKILKYGDPTPELEEFIEKIRSILSERI